MTTMEPAAAVTRLGMITINNYMLLFTVPSRKKRGNKEEDGRCDGPVISRTEQLQDSRCSSVRRMLISAESILSARSPRRALVMTFTATGSFVLRFTALYTCDRGGGGACRAVDRRHPPKERQRKRQNIEKEREKDNVNTICNGRKFPCDS